MRKGDTRPRECSKKSVKMIVEAVLLKVKKKKKGRDREIKIIFLVREHGCYISGIGNTAG